MGASFVSSIEVTARVGNDPKAHYQSAERSYLIVEHGKRYFVDKSDNYRHSATIWLVCLGGILMAVGMRLEQKK